MKIDENGHPRRPMPDGEFTLRRVSGVAALAAVCVLLIIVLGKTQAGPVVGMNYQLPPYMSSLAPLASSASAPLINSTGPSSTSLTNESTLWEGGNPQLQSSRGPNFSFEVPLAVPLWALLVSVVFSLGIILAVLVLRTREPKAIDLKAALKELGNQQWWFSGTLSKMRNAALLRYYVIMVETCARFGIRDGPVETPREFVSRVASELNLDRLNAADFADAVDRAHYDVELLGDEVLCASRLMDAFTKAVVGRIGVG